MNKHPHFGATYKIAQQPFGGFSVKVSIPDKQPVTVTGFATEKLAGGWVTNHQRQIASGTVRRRPGRDAERISEHFRLWEFA